jgi:predicted PurR-regulated permease PerM
VDVSQIKNWINTTEFDSLKSLEAGMSHTIMGIGATLMVIVLIPIYVILILYYRPLLVEFIHKSFKLEHHLAVGKVLINVNLIIKSYLFGLLIEGVIVAVLNSIALLFLGIRYAILLGITGAILNVIPFIGGIIAILLPMIVAFVTKSTFSAIMVFLSYIIIQLIDNHYLIPYVVASKVKINALIAIVVVLIGNEIWGIPGMFLSIPLTALFKVISDNIEALHPVGFLLGDSMPSTLRLDWFLKRMEKGK